MTTYTFKIAMKRPPTDVELDQLFEAGCDDAVFGVERGLPMATFDRDDETLADAIASAVRALESAGMISLRVIDEDVLTLADIADRIGQSREPIRRYATGERAAGGFPPPISEADNGRQRGQEPP